MLEDSHLRRLIMVAVLVGLVLLVFSSGGLETGAATASASALDAGLGVSSSGAPDILLLAREEGGERWFSRWDPHRVLTEIRESAQPSELRRILLQNARNLDEGEIDALVEMLVEEGRREGIDPLFLAALIRVESAFSKDAISDKGARGLMQVMPATGREVAESIGLSLLDEDQLHDPGFNVRLGSRYLGRLLSLYRGNYRTALTAYNRGPHSVRAIISRHGKLGDEYTEYFRKIQDTYRGYLRSLSATAVVLRRLG